MKSSRSAFTLIELLIVITIIGILSAAIVLNFSGVRERQQLALLADKSAAMLQVAQSEVRSGKFDHAVGTYLCEGARFEEGEEPYWVVLPYDSASGSCDFTQKTEEVYGLNTSPAVLGSMTVGDTSIAEFYAMYLPPDATLGFYDALGAAYSGAEAQVFFAGASAENYTVSLELSSLTGRSALSAQTNE